MTELTFEELGTARDAVRSAWRENNYLIEEIREQEQRDRPPSYPQDPCEKHFAVYREALEPPLREARNLMKLSQKLTAMLKERQPE